MTQKSHFSVMIVTCQTITKICHCFLLILFKFQMCLCLIHNLYQDPKILLCPVTLLIPMWILLSLLSPSDFSWSYITLDKQSTEGRFKYSRQLLCVTLIITNYLYKRKQSQRKKDRLKGC